MIFDQPEQPGDGHVSAASGRKRRRRTAEAPAAPVSSGRRRRRSSSRSSFAEASRMSAPEYPAAETNHVAWLWVLVLLVVAALGFGWFLHTQRSAPYHLSGEAPTARLRPYIDPILAPLETGLTGYSPESLAELTAQFRTAREKSGEDSRSIFSTAGTMADILQEALEDRGRHLERLAGLGAEVDGTASTPPAALSETERKHLELAVGISWQRNSGGYRDRLEELWARLQPLEYGRFPGAAKVTAPN